MANNDTKDLFRNEAGGWVSAVLIDGDGSKAAMAVAPGETVWLSEAEQILTANAPRSAEDNPLTNGALVLEAEGRDIRSRRLLRPPAPEEAEETGEAPAPDGEPAEGSRPAGEEVGTPAAVRRPGPRRR